MAPSATIQAIDPRTGEAVYEPLAETTSQELDGAVRDAHNAFAVWAKTPDLKRAEVLNALADALDAHVDELVDIAEHETGLGEVRLTGEVARTSFQLRMFAQLLQEGELLAPHVDEPIEGAPPVGRPRMVRSLVALGPVAVFGASNFPFAFSVLGGDTASALAAGCTVVVKEHPSHPNLSVRVVALARQVFVDHGLPASVLVGVRGFEAGVSLVSHPLISAVGFTGSQGAGRALLDLVNAREVPIPFYGELGSLNPAFITQAAMGARRSELASEAATSIMMGRGQFCTKPALLFIPDDQEFVDELVSQLGEAPTGPLLSPAIRQRFIDSVARVSASSGVTSLVADDDASGLSVGAHLLSVSLEDYLANAHGIKEECFGPSAVIIRCSQDTDYLTVSEDLEGALVAAIHAESGADQEVVNTLVGALAGRVGRIVMNGWPTGLAVSPWQHHGGPYPASTSVLHTSVGGQAMMRFVRPLVIQNATPDQWPGLTSI